MKYLLALFNDESRAAERTPEEGTEAMRRWDEYTTLVTEAGVHRSAEGLAPSSTATSIRFDPGGGQLVTDGPFAETKEQLGGYYLLECEDLDEALLWAKRLPMESGGVEIRPVMDYAAAGSEVHTN